MAAFMEIVYYGKNVSSIDFTKIAAFRLILRLPDMKVINNFSTVKNYFHIFVRYDSSV